MLRTDRRFRGTPIIIVTALNDTDSRLVAIGAGANAYFTKPFYLEDLKSKINSLLEKKPYTGELDGDGAKPEKFPESDIKL
jgi:DNA-binding response OmpR family regulator